MEITLQATDKIVELNGVPARIWEGFTTDGKIPLHAFITRIAVSESEPAEIHERFRSALQETRKPSPDVAAYPLRMIL